MSRMFDEWYHASGTYLLEMPEKWEPLNNYPGYYICKEGYVVNEKNHILPEHKGDKKGHINIRLRKDKKQKEEYLHRLLAKQYIKNPNGYPVVRHLDDDVHNNSLDNLAWGTQKDNHKDSVGNGTYKPFTDEMRRKSYEKSRTPIVAINLKTKKKIHFKGQGEAARILGLQQSNIYKVLVGKRKHTGGYSFKYVRKETQNGNKTNKLVSRI